MLCDNVSFIYVKLCLPFTLSAHSTHSVSPKQKDSSLMRKSRHPFSRLFAYSCQDSGKNKGITNSDLLGEFPNVLFSPFFSCSLLPGKASGWIMAPILSGQTRDRCQAPGCIWPFNTLSLVLNCFLLIPLV